jgi:hypothetical protein
VGQSESMNEEGLVSTSRESHAGMGPGWGVSEREG